MDNTLAPQESDCYGLVRDKLAQFEGAGFKVGVLSNGRGDAMRRKLLDSPYPVIFNALKPRVKNFRKMLHLLDAEPDEAVMIGDQLLTDVLGANRARIYSIYVEPLDPQSEGLPVKLNRVVEFLLLGSRRVYRVLRLLYRDSFDLSN